MHIGLYGVIPNCTFVLRAIPIVFVFWRLIKVIRILYNRVEWKCFLPYLLSFDTKFYMGKLQMCLSIRSSFQQSQTSCQFENRKSYDLFSFIIRFVLGIYFVGFEWI